MNDWRQKLAIYLLICALTLLALVDAEFRHIIIGILVPLFIWVIERKDKVEKEKQKEVKGKTEKKKRKKKRRR